MLNIMRIFKRRTFICLCALFGCTLIVIMHQSKKTHTTPEPPLVKQNIMLSISTDFICLYNEYKKTIKCPKRRIGLIEKKGAVTALEMELNSPVKDIETGPGQICYIDKENHIYCLTSTSAAYDSISRWYYKVNDFDIGTGGIICAINKIDGIHCATNGGNPSISIRHWKVLSDISVGSGHLCALEKESHHVQCWDFDDFAVGEILDGTSPTSDIGQMDGPDEVQFKEISVGDVHSCGLSIDGHLYCWGAEVEPIPPGPVPGNKPVLILNFGQSKPPVGKFVAVTSGAYHSCARKQNGRVACWGRDDFGQASPPSYRFIDIDASGLSTCGVTIKGKLFCWGKATFKTELFE